MSRIEQMISKIEGYIKKYRPSAFPASEIIVQKEGLEEKLLELHVTIPEKLNQSKRTLSNQSAIMLDAQARCNTMVNEVSKKTEQLVNQPGTVQKAAATANETLQNARAQAQNTVNATQAEANDIRLSSIQYMDELLLDVQNIIENTPRGVDTRNQALQLIFRQNFDQVAANRRQLAASNEAAQMVE